jgi:uncharacterized protein YebE (UPF0316 family)
MLQTAIQELGADWLQVPFAFLPLAIFVLRTIDITIATLRTFMVAQGSRGAAWVMALLQSLIFIALISGLLANLQNPLNLIAFAAGFATGNVCGVTIEARLAPGHSLLRIVSPTLGRAIAESLRNKNHGATEIPASGISGTVSLILSFVPRKEVRNAAMEVIQVDPAAYISVENVRLLSGGWHP